MVLENAVIVDLAEAVVVQAAKGVFIYEIVLLRLLGGTRALHPAELGEFHAVGAALDGHVVVVLLGGGAPVEVDGSRLLLSVKGKQFNGQVASFQAEIIYSQAVVGAEVVVDYRAEDFVAAVADATDGAGVDLVFDGVGGQVGEQSLRCVAHDGLYLHVGFASGIEAEELAWVTPRTLCFGNFSVGGVMLSYTSHPMEARAQTGFNIWARSVGEQLHADLVAKLDAGVIRPLVSEVVAFEALPGALDRMEDRSTIGRVVVDVAGTVAR